MAGQASSYTLGTGNVRRRAVSPRQPRSAAKKKTPAPAKPGQGVKEALIRPSPAAP